MILMITVYDLWGDIVHAREIEDYTGQIPRLGDLICFPCGNRAPVTSVEWHFDSEWRSGKDEVWIRCKDYIPNEQQKMKSEIGTGGIRVDAEY